MRSNALDERHERQIKEDVLVVSVIDDVGDLVWKQPRVDGVSHRTRARHTVINFKMAYAVRA